jgi:3-deoxy-manno-octulosonate cytidylyltransferase (CMP-KDO synthetase)
MTQDSVLKTKILGIIPSRFASTRLPGKPLVDIGGKSMIERVYGQAKQSQRLSEVIVATDDDRIADHVTAFGGRVMLTSPEHQSGTDRCAEIASKLPDFDIVINIQGDEPFIAPEQIDLLCSCFESGDVELATLIKKISNEEELNNPGIPKVTLNTRNEAIYFSRATIPYLRNQHISEWVNTHTYYKHIGIYGYKARILQEITRLPLSVLEQAESLEQLRWIENGYRIKTAVTEAESVAIDTPEDLERVRREFL